MVLDTEAFKELKRLTKSQGNFGQSNQRKKRAERRQNFEPNFDDYNYSDYSDSDYEAGGSSRRRQRGTGQVKRPKKQLQATHAITTKLVSHFFGSVFGTEIKDVRKTGCGVCKSCKKVDCSKCANCKMKKKFVSQVVNPSWVLVRDILGSICQDFAYFRIRKLAQHNIGECERAQGFCDSNQF